MTPVRVAVAAILAFIAATLTARAGWNHKTAENGEYRVGKNESKLRVESWDTTVAFSVAPGWHLSKPTFDETGCSVTASSPTNDLSFAFSIHRRVSGIIDPELFKQGATLTWPAHNEDSFRLPDGRRLIPHYGGGEYRSGERYGPNLAPPKGAGLYLYTPEGAYNCTFKFTGSRALGGSLSRHDVQEILNTFEFTRTKRSDRALKM
jgi:hypothetical protein